MQIYGLFGPSGSGKSYMAQYIAQEYHAKWIVDDGLFIWNGHIIAGESAKFEKTKMAAVKRAIFTDPNHKSEVQEALRSLPDESNLLVIGTSQKMVRRICLNLELGEDIIWLPIEEMIDVEEISLARNLRQYGMHAIPINEAKIEETRIGRLLARIRFRSHDSTISLSDAVTAPHHATWTQTRTSRLKARTELLGSVARTIVNPPFAGGAIHIHPRAIRDSILYLVEEQNHPVQLDKVSVELGDIPSIHLRLKTKAGCPIQKVTKELLSSVRTYLSNYLGLSLVYIEIVVVGLIIE